MTYNNIGLFGSVYKELEIKTLPSGQSIGTFTLESDQAYTKKNGEVIPNMLYIDVKMWTFVLDKNKAKLSKGTRIIVDGRLVEDKWLSPDGKKNYKHTITAENITYVDEQHRPLPTDMPEPRLSKEVQAKLADRILGDRTAKDIAQNVEDMMMGRKKIPTIEEIDNDLPF